MPEDLKGDRIYSAQWWFLFSVATELEEELWGYLSPRVVSA